MATDLHGILMGISREHRKYLINLHKPNFPDKSRIKNEDDGATRLARLLGPGGVAPYRFLNMRRSPRLFNLYEAPAGMDKDTIHERLAARHPHWRRGVRPKVTEETPPLFHTMHESGDALEIVYATDGGQQVYFDGYDSHKRRAIVQDKLLVRTTPAVTDDGRLGRGTTTTIEVAGGVRGPAHRDKLIAALAADLGVPVDRFQLRALDTATKREALRAAFDATAYGVEGNGRSKGIASYSWRTKPGTPLEEQEHYKLIKGTHLDPREVEYVFTLAHPDGWHEEVTYYVNHLTGQLKFPPETSEYAINRVRDAAIRITR